MHFHSTETNQINQLFKLHFHAIRKYFTSILNNFLTIDHLFWTCSIRQSIKNLDFYLRFQNIHRARGNFPQVMPDGQFLLSWFCIRQVADLLFQIQCWVGRISDIQETRWGFEKSLFAEQPEAMKCKNFEVNLESESSRYPSHPPDRRQWISN